MGSSVKAKVPHKDSEQSLLAFGKEEWDTKMRSPSRMKAHV